MPLCPESRYIIDSMTELCEVTIDITEFVYHTKVDIDDMVDRNANIKSEVVNLYRGWRPSANMNEQAFISFNGMLGSEHQFNEITTYVTDKMIDAFRQSNGKKSPIGNGFPEINLHIETEDDMLKEHNVLYLLERNKEQEWLRMLETMFIDFVDVKSQVNMKQFLEWEHNRIQKMADAAYMAYLPGLIDPMDDNAIKRYHKKQKQQEILQIKKGQKVLKKGIKTFTNMFGAKDIHAFITGDDFTIEGNRYNYRVSKKYDLVKFSADPRRGHIPYRLQLVTKNDVVLADGCVLFEDTPVVDQLIGMMLHIKNGNEEEILKKTNFFNTEDAYYSEEYLVQLKGIKKPVYGNHPINIADLFLDNGEREDTLKYRPLVRPVVERVLLDMVDIPESAFRFMMKPEITYDHLQFLEAPDVERLLLEKL